MLDKLFEKYQRITVFDVETTGINPKFDEIIEFGIYSTTSDQAHNQIDGDLYSSLVNLSEGRYISDNIVKLTGINNSMLHNEGKEKQVVCKQILKYFSENTLVVAYNAQFDMCFLYYFLNKFGEAYRLKYIKMLDALTIYKDRRKYPHKLENAVEEYAIKQKSTHRASDDARATFELLSRMYDEKCDLKKYINLFGYNPKYGVSGTKIKSVTYKPQPYNSSKSIYE